MKLMQSFCKSSQAEMPTSKVFVFINISISNLKLRSLIDTCSISDQRNSMCVFACICKRTEVCAVSSLCPVCF